MKSLYPKRLQIADKQLQKLLEKNGVGDILLTLWQIVYREARSDDEKKLAKGIKSALKKWDDSYFTL